MLGWLIAAAACAADPAIAVEPLGPARPGGLVRVEVRGSGLPTVAADLRLDAGSATVSLALDDAAALESGAVLVLALPIDQPAPAAVTASLAWQGPPGLPRRLVQASTPLTSPGASLARVAAAAAQLRDRGVVDPLPWLWAEQASEIAAGPPTAAALAAVDAVHARMVRWLDGEQPTVGSDRALRDPVDGSVQPWRLHVPPGDGPFPLALLLAPSTPGLGKASWPAADVELVAAALAAGVALAECYPAGDAGWVGAARRRLPLLVEATARDPRIATATGLCLGPASHPGGLPYPFRRIDALSRSAAWWRAASGPRLPVPVATAWWEAPFAIVVGRGDHRAAAEANRIAAAAVAAAYAAHAHAVVGTVDDRDPDAWAGRQPVFIGNPVSNRALAGYAGDLPWSWDHRQRRAADGSSTLRAAASPLVHAWRLADGRHALLIDGLPGNWAGVLP
jgi:hypothetical protein